MKGRCIVSRVCLGTPCHSRAQASLSTQIAAPAGVSFVITSFLSQPLPSLYTPRSLPLSPSLPHQPQSAPAASFTSLTVPSCALLEAATPRPDLQHCAPYAKQRRVRPFSWASLDLYLTSHITTTQYTPSRICCSNSHCTLNYAHTSQESCEIRLWTTPSLSKRAFAKFRFGNANIGQLITTL